MHCRSEAVIMSTTRDNKTLLGADARRATKLKELLHRWREAYLDGRKVLAEMRQLRGSVASQLAQVADAQSDVKPISADPPATDGGDLQRELVPLPDERAQALAVVCDRLLQELEVG